MRRHQQSTQSLRDTAEPSLESRPCRAGSLPTGARAGAADERRELRKRRASPITAMSVTAVVTSTPGTVSRRRTSSSPCASAATRRSIWASSAPRKSSWRRPGVDRQALVGGQFLGGEPGASRASEEVAHRRASLEVAVQHRRNLILDLRATLDEPAAARDQAAQHAHAFIAAPDQRDEVRGEQVGEHAGVDLVGLHAGMADGLQLARVGECPWSSRRVLMCTTKRAVPFARLQPFLVDGRERHVRIRAHERTRAGRRGGQLHQRARSPTKSIGLPLIEITSA